MSLLTAYNTQEECAEVIQAISKCLRFGPDRANPINDVVNKDHLAYELGQLEYMMFRLESEMGLSRNKMLAGYKAKSEMFDYYASLQPVGT